MWANLRSSVYHFAGKFYGNTKRGVTREVDATRQGMQRGQAEQHP